MPLSGSVLRDSHLAFADQEIFMQHNCCDNQAVVSINGKCKVSQMLATNQIVNVFLQNLIMGKQLQIWSADISLPDI